MLETVIARMVREMERSLLLLVVMVIVMVELGWGIDGCILLGAKD